MADPVTPTPTPLQPAAPTTPDPATPIATADQINYARQSGYSDQDIVDFLTPKAPEQFQTATQAGYSPKDILDHLAAQTPTWSW